MRTVRWVAAATVVAALGAPTPATGAAATPVTAARQHPSSGETGTRLPVPSATSTELPGESIAGERARRLQEAVDDGHQPWRLDALQVAVSFADARFGWTDADSRLLDPHTAEVTNRATGEKARLRLAQPAREGSRGIWAIVSCSV
jgi:hypothetical protein